MSEPNTEQNPGNTGTNSNQTGAQSGFSLSEADIQRIADASTRQAAQRVSNSEPASANSGASSNDAQGNQSQQSGTDILTAIQALPETVARAVKEAVGNTGSSSQSSGASSNDSQQQGQQQTQQPHTPGKKRGFTEWWFGN